MVIVVSYFQECDIPALFWDPVACLSSINWYLIFPDDEAMHRLVDLTTATFFVVGPLLSWGFAVSLLHVPNDVAGQG